VAICSAPLTIIAVRIGVHWGAVGVSAGFAIASALLVPVGVWYCLKGSPLSAGDFWGAVWRAAASSIIAAVAVWILRSFLPFFPQAFVRLFIDSAIYSVLYITLWLLLPGGRADLAMICAKFVSFEDLPILSRDIPNALKFVLDRIIPRTDQIAEHLSSPSHASPTQAVNITDGPHCCVDEIRRAFPQIRLNRTNGISGEAAA